MSMIIVKPIDEKGHLSIRKLYDKYSSFLVKGAYVMCFANRVFNDKQEIVLIPKVSIEAKFIKLEYDSIIDLMPIVTDYGIAKGYYIEVIASNILLETDGEKRIIPIFPNEIASDCEYSIQNIIKDEIEMLKNVGRSYETIGVLHHKGFEEIAEDFREAIIRFERYDYEGSIKFFRKVIEGFREFAKDNIIVTKNRTDVIKVFLTKTFHLMSNFGEHTGTKGSLEEAILSKDITMAISEYIAKKI